MKWTEVAATAALMACLGAPISAQEAGAFRSRALAPARVDTMHPSPGERVRFVAPAVVAGLQYARFRQIDSLHLKVDPHVGTLENWAIPLKDLESLEGRRRNGNAGARTGALIGMIAGGLLLGGGAYLAAGGTANEYAGIAPLIFTPVGIGAGAIAGTLIGRAKSYSWVRLTLPSRADLQRRRQGG